MLLFKVCVTHVLKSLLIDSALTLSPGTTVAIYEVGCAIGALSCVILGDILGRRRTIFLAGCIVIVGVILQATPFQLGQLIVARVITGKIALQL
jgi:MFS family permease